MNTFHLNKNITGEIKNTATQAFYRDKIYYWDEETTSWEEIE